MLYDAHSRIKSNLHIFHRAEDRMRALLLQILCITLSEVVLSAADSSQLGEDILKSADSTQQKYLDILSLIIISIKC